MSVVCHELLAVKDGLDICAQILYKIYDPVLNATPKPKTFPSLAGSRSDLHFDGMYDSYQKFYYDNLTTDRVVGDQAVQDVG